MERTLQGQLLTVPIPRLSTVLRLNVKLPDEPSAFDAAANLILGWWNKKAESYGVQIDSCSGDFTFVLDRFKAEFAGNAELFALSMEEPDSDLRTGRDWICDFGLRRMEADANLEVRVSYRQPNNSFVRPDPRAPKFLRDILAQIGAVDDEPLRLRARTVKEEEVDQFISLLFSNKRKLPVIAVSEEVFDSNSLRETKSYLLAGSLGKLLAGTAHVVYLTPNASWQLSNRLTPELSVYQGAVRCYNAPMSWTDNKFSHRLWVGRDIARADAAQRDGFLNVCTSHVFTQVTAYFESLPLLSPAIIRRQTKALVATERAVPDTPFVLVEPEVLAKQLALESLIYENRDSIEEPLAERLHVEKLGKENEDLRALLQELTVKFAAQEELSVVREREAADQRAQLEQERAGRAEDARARQDAEDTRWLQEEEIKELKERDQLLTGAETELSEPLRPMWRNMSSLFGALQQIATQFRRFEGDSTQLLVALEEKENLTRENALLDAKFKMLEHRSSQSISVMAAGENDIGLRHKFQQILPGLIRNPSVEVVLRVCATLYEDRCEVLPSALLAAENSEDFQRISKLYDLLCKLLTEYWEAMNNGKGDVVARTAFGSDSYAAKESETISKSGWKRRTFLYKGQELRMEKHLKIGVADNSSDTLRVHFEWVPAEKKIVIGHCGSHLDF